jgi:hypothetical protein
MYIARKNKAEEEYKMQIWSGLPRWAKLEYTACYFLFEKSLRTRIWGAIPFIDPVHESVPRERIQTIDEPSPSNSTHCATISAVGPFQIPSGLI